MPPHIPACQSDCPLMVGPQTHEIMSENRPGALPRVSPPWEANGACSWMAGGAQARFRQTPYFSSISGWIVVDASLPQAHLGEDRVLGLWWDAHKGAGFSPRALLALAH